MRKWLLINLSSEISEEMRIIYGGSVKPKTAEMLIACDDIDGFLVGGCSLSGDFIDIVNSCPAEFDYVGRKERGLVNIEAIRSLAA